MEEKKKGRVIVIPAAHEKSFEEEIEEGRREWDKRIEEFSQLGHEFYKTRHGEELAAQEKLIGLKAIENYLEVQLEEIRNEINALETELKTSDKG